MVFIAQRWVEGRNFICSSTFLMVNIAQTRKWGIRALYILCICVTIGAADNLVMLQVVSIINNVMLSIAVGTLSFFFLKTMKITIKCKQTMTCAHQNWQHVSIVITNYAYACIRREFQVCVVNHSGVFHFPWRVWSQLKSGLCHTIHYHSRYTFYNESTWN